VHRSEVESFQLLGVQRKRQIRLLIRIQQTEKTTDFWHGDKVRWQQPPSVYQKHAVHPCYSEGAKLKLYGDDSTIILTFHYVICEILSLELLPIWTPAKNLFATLFCLFTYLLFHFCLPNFSGFLTGGYNLMKPAHQVRKFLPLSVPFLAIWFSVQKIGDMDPGPIAYFCSYILMVSCMEFN